MSFFKQENLNQIKKAGTMSFFKQENLNQIIIPPSTESCLPDKVLASSCLFSVFGGFAFFGRVVLWIN